MAAQVLCQSVQRGWLVCEQPPETVQLGYSTQVNYQAKAIFSILAYNALVPSLFDPLELRGLTLRNRIGMSPMCTYSCDKLDGVPTPWHLVHLGARALGGCGLVSTEASAVELRGRISLKDAGIWDDSQVAPWQAVSKLILEAGAIPCIQLAHAGRKAGTRPPFDGRGVYSDDELAATSEGLDALLPIAPSPIPFAEDYRRPHELTANELLGLINTWESATRRAQAAGFQALELHMAHGYLLHEFLSPVTNKRTDMYGGGLSGRMHFPLMVAQAVRSAWPADLPLFVRISCTDYLAGGWTLDEAVEFCKSLKEVGVDLIGCSSGGIAPGATGSPLGGGKLTAGHQVPFAKRIQAEAGIPTAAVGLIIEAKHANQIVEEGHASVVLLGRELLRNPNWAINAAQALGVEADWPKQYNWAVGSG